MLFEYYADDPKTIWGHSQLTFFKPPTSCLPPPLIFSANIGNTPLGYLSINPLKLKKKHCLNFDNGSSRTISEAYKNDANGTQKDGTSFFHYMGPFLFPHLHSKRKQARVSWLMIYIDQVCYTTTTIDRVWDL